ncbi:MAG: hypothetical protein C0616_07935 [Desulfuromonas sp.]|nr:MAG: hypothetical protein C0616_07935 [Desulfuromonas sp.]
MTVWRDLGLFSKTSIIIALVLVVFFFVGAVVEYRQQREFIIEEAIAKAELVAAEAIRSREYLSAQLTTGKVELSLDRYGLIPVVASQRIGEQVGIDLGYRIRQVSLRNRNPKNAPDPFEEKILNRFISNPAVDEGFAISTLDKEQVFRYLKPFRVEESCLVCHGVPDEAPGFIKQLFPPESDRAYNYKIGEIIGAASVTIPMERLQQRLIINLRDDLVALGAMLLALVFCLGLLTRVTVVNPLGRFNASIERIIRTGRFDQKLPLRGRDEIGRLVAAFNEMLDHLSEKSRHIEESEQRYRALTESARNPIISFLANGQIILFNRQAEKVFGYSKREALGLHIRQLIDPDCPSLDGKDFDEFWQGELSELLSETRMISCRSRDGSAMQLELSLTEVETEGGGFYTSVLRRPPTER